jgi:hypothetical protein
VNNLLSTRMETNVNFFLIRKYLKESTSLPRVIGKRKEPYENFINNPMFFMLDTID